MGKWEGKNRSKFLQVLLDAVKPLIWKDKQYKDVQKCITRDDDFVKVIGKWVDKIIIHFHYC